jgi:DNA-binding CsgD family transcriptional regulator
VLVGRDKEQRALDEVLDDACAARGRVLALVGEAGIGKSALLAYAGEAAQRLGMTVLRARGVQSEAQVAFAALSELLRPVLSFVEAIPAPQAAALEGALALRPAAGADRFAVGSATLSLLATVAERSPLLVLVDDGHWLDGSSADALRFAARRLSADPVAMVLALRDGEPSLLDGSDLPRLALPGLDRAAAGELLQRHAPPDGPRRDEQAVDRLYRETGGNPLALVELAEVLTLDPGTALLEPVAVTTTIAEAYASRCAGLPGETRRLLVLLAASDADDLGVILRPSTALGLDVTAIAPAEAAGLITVQGAGVEWRHPLVRSAVYAGAEPAERRAAHRALAEALPDADADRRAWHLALAALGPDAAASSALSQAGARARERSAYDVASRTFERAATLAPVPQRRAGLLYAAADAAFLAGLAERAVTLLDQACALPADEDVAVSIAHLRGHIATRRGHLDAGRSLLLEAAEQAAAIDPARAVVIFAEALYAAFYAGQPAAMRQVATRVAALRPACTDPRSTFFASMAEGMALVLAGGGDDGPRLIREAIGLLEGSNELREDPRLLAWAVMGPVWLREEWIDDSLVDRALSVARSVSATGVLPFLLGHVGCDRSARDRWAEAEAAFYEAIEVAAESGQYTEQGLSVARLAWLEARQGKEQRCREHAGVALELARGYGFAIGEVFAFVALGDLELGLGHAEEARERYLEQEEVLERLGIEDVDLRPGPELVEVYLRTGSAERAASVAEQYQHAAAAKGQPWARARAARAQGLVASDDAFEEHFEHALALHELTPDVYEAARTRLAYGARLRRARRRVTARRQLRAAIEIFDRLGADPWSDAARRELAATGETVSPRAPGSLTRLTPQELQIALLLAGGRTTRQAAAALFVSPKTVEYHLRSIYRKLGVSSRDELAAALSPQS